MKSIMAILMSMVMAIALVSYASAAAFPAPGNLSASVYQANSAVAGGIAASAAGAAGDDYSCVSTPAYSGYVNVHPVPCPANSRPLQAPSVMGAW